MTDTHPTLYPLQKKDIRPAAAMLADAFQDDPIWKALLADATIEQRRAAFETPARYGLKYGQIYAPSAKLEGVAVWLPGELSDMTFWRVLRSGAAWAGMKLGQRVARLMGPVFGPIEVDRRAHMQGKPYLYLLILGVAPAYQGQGYASRLLRALIEQSERSGLPIYLETETEENVRMYEHFGFRVVKQIRLPIIDVPMWEMLRDE